MRYHYWTGFPFGHCLKTRSAGASFTGITAQHSDERFNFGKNEPFRVSFCFPTRENKVYLPFIC